MNPTFIKADLSFDPPDAPPENELGISSSPIIHLRQNISVFGCMGLPWGELNPQSHFGRRVNLQVRSVEPGNLFFSTPGHLIREATVSSERMGIRFDLSSAQRERLAEQIRNHGFNPPEGMRKYPRIPSSARIASFPLRVLGVTLPESHAPDPAPAPHLGVPMVYEVLNLSPQGILLSSENRLAQQIGPGTHLAITFEPRGPSNHGVRVQGQVCRVTDTIESASDNVSRMLGMKFTYVDPVNRTAFLDLLRDILERIRAGA
jgi:hypothetical protein